jgi:hypothetical protein
MISWALGGSFFFLCRHDLRIAADPPVLAQRHGE